VIHIVQAADQVNQAALARSCATDHADRLAGLDMQVDIGQGVFAAAVLVGEVDVVEIDAAVRHLHDRLLRIVQVGGLVEYFADTADARHGHADHDHNHGQHHQAHQQTHDVAEQAGQVASGQTAAHNKLRAQPGNRDDTEIHGDHH